MCLSPPRFGKKTAFVVVLGDLGRSPRMRNHAISLANEGMEVQLTGYGGSELSQTVLDHENIRIRTLPPPPAWFGSLPRLLAYALKVLWQTVTLFFSLPLFGGAPELILLQNPPSVPAMPVCYFYALMHRRTRLVVDWHNYGYTILALALGDGHLLVKLCRTVEMWFGRKADAAFCVTEAMRKDLLGVDWQLPSVTTLHDRAPERFGAVSLQERHRLFMKLGELHPAFLDRGERPAGATVFTEVFARGRVSLRADRPGLLVSSTSWTDDEDFSVLLSALEMYECECAAATPRGSYPPIICVITGKGPRKSYYEQLIRSKSWTFVSFATPWLSADDYPRLLASADLGVSLHTSSSGLDLPMKVVDMFGSGLPVAAIRFPCLHELVRDGHNGMVFDDAPQLARQLLRWFDGFPNEDALRLHKKYRDGVAAFQSLRWTDYWKSCA